MIAIILAAGESKRLRPLTESTPKCLLELDGKAIIDYQIDHLKSAGVKKSVVVTGFMAPKLESHLTERHPDFEFTFIRSTDYQKTYPAHGLWLTKEFMESEFLYLNADVVFHPDILKRTLESRHDTVTAIQRNPWDEEAVNVILTNDSTQIAEIGKNIARTLNDGEFIGVTKIGKEFSRELVKVLDHFIEKEEFKKFAADAINLAIQRRQEMHVIDVTDLPAIEVDTIEDFTVAQDKIKLINA